MLMYLRELHISIIMLALMKQDIPGEVGDEASENSTILSYKIIQNQISEFVVHISVKCTVRGSQLARVFRRRIL